MQKFRDVLSRWERRELSMLEAGEWLGMSERQFRRYRARFEEKGMEGLADKRLGKALARRVPVDETAWMLEQYRTYHTGWTVKHFHDIDPAKVATMFSVTRPMMSTKLIRRSTRTRPSAASA